MKRLLVFVLLAIVLFSLSAIAFNGHLKLKEKER